MEITVEMVKELREITGMSCMECKKALFVTEGNVAEALKYLKELPIPGCYLRK